MNLLRRHSSAQPRRPSGPRRFPEQTTFTKQESSSRASHTVHSTEYARDRPRRSAGSTDSGVRWGFGPVRASACPRRGVEPVDTAAGCRLLGLGIDDRSVGRPKGLAQSWAEVSLCLVCVRRATQHCATTADGALAGHNWGEGGVHGAPSMYVCVYVWVPIARQFPNWLAKTKTAAASRFSGASHGKGIRRICRIRTVI